METVKKHLTAKQREAQKTKAERAEDIAYTINHSIACTLTDFINPVVNTLTEGRIKGIGGCGHDHSGDHGHHAHDHHEHEHHEHASHDHEHHGHGHEHTHVHSPQALAETAEGGSWWDRLSWNKFTAAAKTSFSKERLLLWVKGEFIGDFGAVPLTIATQRWCPTFMDGIRKITEPVLGPVFRYGIERSSKKWAMKTGVNIHSQEYKDHVNGVYEHEISHLPQAVMWTGYSLALNVGYQKYKDASRPLPGLIMAALSGMAVTAGLVVGTRALAPHKVRQFDKFTSTHMLLPATKLVGQVFGVDAQDVERMAQKQNAVDESEWTARMRSQDIPERSLS